MSVMEEVEEAPSLISLCIEAISKEILLGDDVLMRIYDLPPHLFDSILTRLPPLLLQKLQDGLSLRSCCEPESSHDCFRRSRKRPKFENMEFSDDTMYGNFNTVWKRLFISRWPDHIKHLKPKGRAADHLGAQCDLTNDWLQKYWEAHMQDCIDETAEVAMLPSYNTHIGEIKIPVKILKFIGYEEHMSYSTRDYSKLSNHCQQFAKYARCLRLQNVLCCEETCNLLRDSKLQSLVLRRIKSNAHVDGVCKLLRQNNESLKSLEFINCMLPANAISAICDSLHIESRQTHMLQNFSVKASNFLKRDIQDWPHGLVSLLSGRSLCSLTFSENHHRSNFAKKVFNTLLEASSSVAILDLSDNNIFGWLSYLIGEFSNFPSAPAAIGKSLQSIRVLNLRGNNLRKSDVNSLTCALYLLPNLETLDLSDNRIGDDGLRSLISCFGEASQRLAYLSNLKLESCKLSCNGVTELLQVLLTLNKPLESLSISDNHLGSEVASILAKFMTGSVKVLDAELIGLAPSGFVDLDQAIGKKEMNLVYINISKNRGGVGLAKFLPRILSQAPELVAIKAAHNFVPATSWSEICDALRIAKGKIEHLDMTGNACNEQDYASIMKEFLHNGKPIVAFSSSVDLNAPYDHDP